MMNLRIDEDRIIVLITRFIKPFIELQLSSDHKKSIKKTYLYCHKSQTYIELRLASP